MLQVSNDNCDGYNSSSEAGNKAFIDLVAAVGSSGERLYSGPEEFFSERQGLGSTLFPETPSEPMSYSAGQGRRAEFYNNLLGPMAQLQLQATLREQRPHERPLLPGGLVASADCLHWTTERISKTASSGRR